jgi:hypothetical protein
MRHAAITALVATALAGVGGTAQAPAGVPKPPTTGGGLPSRLHVFVCLGEQPTSAWCSPSPGKKAEGPAATAGTVAAKSAGIQCPNEECEAVVTRGTTIKLTARPNEAGYSPHKFVRWDGCTSWKDTVCTVKVGRKAEVRAVFVSTTS